MVLPQQLSVLFRMGFSDLESYASGRVVRTEAQVQQAGCDAMLQDRKMKKKARKNISLESFTSTRPRRRQNSTSNELFSFPSRPLDDLSVMTYRLANRSRLVT